MLHQIAETGIETDGGVIETEMGVIMGPVDFKGPVPADLAAVEAEGFLSNLIAGFAAEGGEGLIPVADDRVLFIFVKVELLYFPGTVFPGGGRVFFCFSRQLNGVFRGIGGGFMGAVAVFPFFPVGDQQQSGLP